MKKFLTLLCLCTLTLSACGGEKESDNSAGSIEESEEVYFFTYRTGDFEIDVPDTWERVTSFSSEYPEEVRIAFRNNIKDGEFLANVNVVLEENSDNLSTMDYAQEKLKDHADTLLNFQLQTEEQLSLDVKGGTSTTLLHTFSGKNSASGPSLEFMQVSVASADEAWTVTASYRTNEDPFVVERMKTMLTSFTLR